MTKPALGSASARQLEHLHSIAWIDRPAPNGAWAEPQQLGLELNDRGLLLADGLFETLLVAHGQPLLLRQHLERWCLSARLLGLPKPPNIKQVAPLVAEAVARSGIQQGALRLNWSRGVPTEAGRGIDLPQLTRPCFWLQFNSCSPSFGAITVILSRWERRNAASLLSRCKTFAYGQAIQARREAKAAGVDDAVLLNTKGQLCCGSTANILLRQHGRWFTPPLSSGCLPGILRAQALRGGQIQARPLQPEMLAACEAALLINSLGCRPIKACDGKPLPAVTSSEAEQLWWGLLALG